MNIAGDFIIAAGIMFILIGVIGIYRFKDFFVRLLISAKIDTVGAITIVIGVAVKHGFSFFSLKVLLLLAIMMIVNPLTSHIIARSAHQAGYGEEH
jgi:multicomponent Na+:H+ antiporter subunit G